MTAIEQLYENGYFIITRYPLKKRDNCKAGIINRQEYITSKERVHFNYSLLNQTHITKKINIDPKPCF